MVPANGGSKTNSKRFYETKIREAEAIFAGYLIELGKGGIRYDNT